MAAAAILNIEKMWPIKPFLTEHVVNIKCRLAGRKTANINVKNCLSLKRGVYRPYCTYKTVKMIYQN